MTEESPASAAISGKASRTTRFATRAHHRLSYEVRGGDADQTVLGLHDLLTPRHDVHPLGAEGLRLILPDARGHGASSTISGRTYGVAELAADNLAILDAEGIERFAVVAVGWGAATALALAMRAPERVTSLILIAPYVPGILLRSTIPPVRDLGTDHVDRLRAAANAADRGQRDRAIDLLFGLRLGSDWREGLTPAQHAAARRSGADLAPLLNGFLDPFPNDDALASIAAPVRIICPADAPPVVDLVSRRLVEVLPQAEIDQAPANDETMASVRAVLLAPG